MSPAAVPAAVRINVVASNVLSILALGHRARLEAMAVVVRNVVAKYATPDHKKGYPRLCRKLPVLAKHWLWLHSYRVHGSYQ